MVGTATEGDNEITWTQDQTVGPFGNNIVLELSGSGESYVNSFQLFIFNSASTIYTKGETEAAISNAISAGGFIGEPAVDEKLSRALPLIYGNDFEDDSFSGVISKWTTVNTTLTGGQLQVGLVSTNAAVSFGPRLDFEPFYLHVIIDVEILDNPLTLMSNWSETESTSILDINTSGRYHIILSKLKSYTVSTLERVLIRAQGGLADTNFNLNELKVFFFPEDRQQLALMDQVNGASIILGENASATGTEAVAIGRDTLADNQYSVVLGRGAKAYLSNFYSAVGGPESCAIGHEAVAHGWRTTAFGPKSIAGGQSSVVLGAGAVARGTHGVALGRGALNPTNGQGGHNVTVHSNMIIYFGNGWGHKFNLPDSGLTIGDNDPINDEVELHGIDAFDARYEIWDVGAAYNIGDYIQYNDKVYKSLTANNGQQPDISTSDWLFIQDTSGGGPSEFNVAGGHIALHAGRGTGTGQGGEVRFYSAPQAGVGQNTKNASVLAAKITAETAADLSSQGTRFYLLHVSNNTLYRVQIGANDSGGAGKRALIIDNA